MEQKIDKLLENTKKNDTLHNKAIIVDELPNGQNIIYMKKEIW